MPAAKFEKNENADLEDKCNNAVCCVNTEIIQVLHKLFQRTKMMACPDSLYETH